MNLAQHGGVYKLAFGPKSFVVVSDPIVARHILRENAFSYDKVWSQLSLEFCYTWFSPFSDRLFVCDMLWNRKV